MRVSGLANDFGFASAHAQRGAIASLWRVVVALAVNLHQLRVIDLTTKSVLNGLEVRAVAVILEQERGIDPKSALHCHGHSAIFAVP